MHANDGKREIPGIFVGGLDQNTFKSDEFQALLRKLLSDQGWKPEEAEAAIGQAKLFPDNEQAKAEAERASRGPKSFDDFFKVKEDLKKKLDEHQRRQQEAFAKLLTALGEAGLYLRTDHAELKFGAEGAEYKVGHFEIGINKDGRDTPIFCLDGLKLDTSTLTALLKLL